MGNNSSREAARMSGSSEARVQQKSDAPKGRKSPKLKRMGLHERAAARMRTMIIRGELPPGSQTQETRLSKELGVSRTPLREAMKVLAGLLVIL